MRFPTRFKTAALTGVVVAVEEVAVLQAVLLPLDCA